MSGSIITPSATSTIDRSGEIRRASLTQSRAARELGLKRSEFELAVQLGRIRTVPDEGGGGRRVTRAEIDRLRAQEGFPEALQQRVKAVGTQEAAQLVDVTPTRFTRLARLGAVVPVKFYLNRYRAVVWLYLAEELRQFAADENNRPLLTGRARAALRELLQEGLDLRPRTWRQRHLGFLLRQAGDDPWARAAAVACLLDPVDVSEVVEDPHELAHLDRHRPRLPVYGAPGSPAAELAETILTVGDADEIAWLRADLAEGVAAARAQRPVPKPTPPPPASEEEQVGPEEPAPPRGLLGWLRRRGSSSAKPGTPAPDRG